jgi:hypothetical protein
MVHPSVDTFMIHLPFLTGAKTSGHGWTTLEGVGPSPAQNRFPDVPSYDVHHRLVTTHARDLGHSNALLDALAKRSTTSGRKVEFEFATTPYAFCEVLSVATPETTVALLDAGITDADEAVAFLEEAELDDLIEDNVEVAEAAMRWAALPRDVLDRFEHSPETFYEDPDGFEGKLREDLLAKLRSDKEVWAALKERRIELQDLLQIGITRFLEAEDDDGTLAEMLALLQADRNQAIPAEAISGWIERFRIDASTPSEVKQGLYRLASRHGADFAAKIPPDAVPEAFRLSREAQAQGQTIEDERGLILFGVRVRGMHGLS